ncbi:PDZ domain-containing protein [Caerostris extrusa]|uniref:PDZ domain-containing protein n=1 Tax=Caerostris extrusa TaxID=172846 RepID=A0AAV4RE82_CAEEX|nr:PDZ domain-containing protein [Caerostris extrusa]
MPGVSNRCLVHTRRLQFAWCVVCSSLAWAVEASPPPCYPPGGVAGIVVATVVVTCVVGGLGAALFYRYWWSARQNEGGRADDPSDDPQSKGPTEFAFDNPYFRNNQESTEDGNKGKYSSFAVAVKARSHRGRVEVGCTNRYSLTRFRSAPILNLKNSLRSSRLSEGGRSRKGKKQKAMDDSCIANLEPERTVVSLKGHDFTGLGFNIMGNMRDGILVKDVLHRGPASESGLIKAGDKIVSVSVSFGSIVYEDALTILSYASPYDVRLELERKAPRRLGSSSFSDGGHKLFHPLYRSQSIDDLTQIDRPPPSATPRPQHDVSALLSATGSLNEKMLANVMAEASWKTQFEASDRYLDGPHVPHKLEVCEMEDERAAMQQDIPHSNPSAPRTSQAEDDTNDSDVSKDSLEISGRFQKRSVIKSSPLTTTTKQPVAVQIENPTTVRLERISNLRSSQTSSSTQDRIGHASRIKVDCSIHENPPRTRVEEDNSKDTSRIKEDYGAHEDPSGVRTADPYRNSSHGGERQKLNTSDAFTQSYGCRTQLCNGRPEGQSQKYSEEPIEKDGRSKRGALNTAGGMFTQISPFQQKQRQLRGWGAREELAGPPRPKFSLRDSSVQHRQF